MKIKYITEDGLNTIKENLADTLYKVVLDSEMSIETLFGDPSFIKESSMSADRFELVTSQPKGKESLTDFDNIQRVYLHLKFLSDSQASDERIWAAYSLSEFLDYMRYRWPAKKVDDLKNRYLFGYSVQRSLFRNGIARLWWIGRVTYDESRSDPFELTRFLCQDQYYIENICGRNIFNNPTIGNAVVSALFDAEKNGITINRELIRKICKYINLLSGTYLLDSLDKEEIYSKVIRRIGEE